MRRTISDVIAELEAIKEEHGDLPVVVDGYEGGLSDPSGFNVTQLVDRAEACPMFEGRYQSVDYVDPEVDAELLETRFLAIHIER